MAVLTGMHGTFTWEESEEAAVRNWRLNKISENHAYHTNDSGDARQRLAGVKDSNGSFEMLDKPTFTEGDIGTLALYSGYQDIYTLEAIIDTIEVNTDIDGGAPVGHTVNFSGAGTIQATTGSAP